MISKLRSTRLLHTSNRFRGCWFGNGLFIVFVASIVLISISFDAIRKLCARDKVGISGYTFAGAVVFRYIGGIKVAPNRPVELRVAQAAHAQNACHSITLPSTQGRK